MSEKTKTRQQEAEEYQDEVKKLNQKFGFELYATVQMQQDKNTGIVGLVPVMAIRDLRDKSE